MSNTEAPRPAPDIAPAESSASPNVALSGHGEVAGSFLLGFIQSFYNLNALPQGGLNIDLENIDPAGWYPHALLMEASHSIKEAIPTSDSLFFQAGVNFLRIWYEHGPGKTMIHSTLDWLHANDEAGGYNTVVRGGPKDEIGWCRVQSIDEQAGVAVIESVTPMTSEFVNGLYYGGCLIFDDVDYVSVEGSSEPYDGNPTFSKVHTTVHFRLKPNDVSRDLDECLKAMQSGAPISLNAQEVERLAWRHRWTEYQRDLDRKYFNDLNVVLAEAVLVSQRVTRELATSQAALKSTNGQLEEREAFTRAMMESSPSGMTVTTQDGEVRQISDKATDMLGYTIEDFRANKSTRDLYANSKDRERFIAALERDGQVRDFECRLRRKDGTEFWCLLNSSFVCIGSERLLTTWVHDISELKATNAQNSTARAQLQAMMDAAPALIFMKDREGRYQSVNRNFKEFTGLEIEQILGHTDREIVSANRAMEIEAEDRRVFESGELIEVEQSMTGGDGRTRDYLRVKFPLRDDEGRIYAIAAIASDITERKTAEEALKQSETYNRMLFQESHRPMVVHDPEKDGFIDCNPAAVRAYGYSTREELLGKTPLDVSAPTQYDGVDSKTKIAQQDASAFEQGVVSFPWRHQRPNGEIWDAMVHLMKFNLGERELLQFTLDDITESKRAEEALLATHGEQNAIFETATSGIALLKDRTILRCNRMLEEIFAYGPDELLGQSTRIWYSSEEDFARGGREGYAEIARGVTRRSEQQLVRKDGSSFWCRLTGRAVDAADPSKGSVWMLEDVTDERAAALAMRAMAKEQELLLENVQVGILFTGDAKMLRVNTKFAELFGFSGPSEVAGLDTKILFSDESEYGRFVAAAGPELAAGKTFDVEWTGRRRDGSTFLGHTIASAIQVPGYRYATIWIVEDITERKHAEEALSQARFLGDQALEMTKAGYWTVDYATPEYYTSSERAAALFGELPTPGYRYHLGDEWASRIAAADPAIAEATGIHYAAAVAGTVPHYDFIYPYRRPVDGRTIWVHAIGNVVRDDDGKPLKMYGVAQDITDRKAAEDALIEAKNRADTYLNANTSSVLIINAEAQIVDCSAGFLNMLGYQQLSDIAGKHPAALAPEFQSDGKNSIAKGDEMVGIAIERGRHTFDWTSQSAQGVLIPIEITIVPVMLGGQLHLMGIHYDLRTRVAMEMELRTAKMAAEDATQAKSMFLANMSHEIRTPMNAVIGMAHLALKTELNAKQRDYVQKIHNAGTSLLGIINDILDFSKIEAGKLDMESIDFSLDETLANLATIVGQKVADKGLEFLIDVPAALPRDLVGDPLRLGQILVNLVSNAVKFTELGEIAVRIRELERTGEKLKLQIDVRDSGIGMTREQCGKLFQAFSQADGSITRKFGGTGLGLTISKRLVEVMGGTIWVDSEPGAGSNFQFTAWFGLSAKRHALRRVVPEALNGLRVLVVDDSAMAREVILDALADQSFDMRTVNSGEEAIAEVEMASATGKPFDVVFMDWRMPGMGGAEAARRVKEHKTLSHIPRVVMVTAFGREEVRQEADQAQIDGFLVKPVNASTLVDTLIGLYAKEEAGVVSAAMVSKSWGLQGVRVLLAEDNEINQQIALELLEFEGVVVDVTSNGEEAVNRLLGTSKDTYDAVLMDLQMPVMGGIEATQKIREQKRFAALPIIAMTAHAMAEERQKCADAGMQDHITKPIDPDTLYRTLAAWCKATAAARSDAPMQGRTIQDVEPIPRVEGLDASAGMKRVAGNRDLYLKLLRQFVEGNASTAESVRTSLGLGDRKTAERIAHTANGVSGNIGARAVQALAAELELAIVAGSETEALIERFANELGTMLRSIQSALGTMWVEASVPERAVDPTELKLLLERLSKMLEVRDGEALELFLDEEAVLKPALGAGFSAIEEAVKNFDFDEALEMLKDAAAMHSVIL